MQMHAGYEASCSDVDFAGFCYGLPGRRSDSYVWRQVVYGDLRHALLEEAYRHAVERARLGPVLTQLDDALGTLCSATPKHLHPGSRTCPPCRCSLLPAPARNGVQRRIFPLSIPPLKDHV